MKYLFDSARNQASNRKHLLELVQTESAKLRGLRGNHGLRGCVCCVGQVFTRATWAMWVKIFVTWVKILRASQFLRGLCGSNIFLCGSAFLA